MENTSEDWKFEMNPGGASLMFKGAEIAHVGDAYCARLRSLRIPENGMTRAKWLCGLLNASAKRKEGEQ